jgi:hypothetical protein
MPIVKQRTKVPEARKRFQIPVDVVAELALYAEFLKEEEDFIVTEGLRACFKSDSKFKDLLAPGSEQSQKLAEIQARLEAQLLTRQNGTAKPRTKLKSRSVQSIA